MTIARRRSAMIPLPPAVSTAPLLRTGQIFGSTG
jgi:hypothetical protein